MTKSQVAGEPATGWWTERRNGVASPSQRGRLAEVGIALEQDRGSLAVRGDPSTSVVDDRIGRLH